MDVIKINVPTFLRLLELVREEVKSDPDLHDITEIVTVLSENDVITMKDYDAIVNYMKITGNDNDEPSDEYNDQLNDLKRLGGIKNY